MRPPIPFPDAEVTSERPQCRHPIPLCWYTVGIGFAEFGENDLNNLPIYTYIYLMQAPQQQQFATGTIEHTARARKTNQRRVKEKRTGSSSVPRRCHGGCRRVGPRADGVGGSEVLKKIFLLSGGFWRRVSCHMCRGPKVRCREVSF